ncbi:MAG TPA: GNAT family N-acetyltransferase [Gammaproteobacteria bacterium]|nr:GNAT family N-acetyltransferase [Gammaproteobacteria bacterium]
MRVERLLAACMNGGDHSVHVAEDSNGEIVGYASVHWLPTLFLPDPEGYVSELFVAEAHRGRGVGRALLDTIVSEARARACSRLMLITNRSRESYVRRFYSKAGWIERDGMANFVLEL